MSRPCSALSSFQRNGCAFVCRFCSKTSVLPVACMAPEHRNTLPMYACDIQLYI